jgi:hypothetical protein
LAIAAMSAIFISGLVGVSINMALVLGVMLDSIADKEVVSTVEKSMENLAKIF